MRNAIVCLVLSAAMLPPFALAQKEEAAAAPQRMTVHKKWGYISGTVSGVIQDEETWQRLWKDGKDAKAPPVDFKKQMVISVVASLPNSTYTFHGVIIERYEGSRIEVRIHTSTSGGVGLQMATQDGGLYVVDRSTLPVRFGALLD